MEGISDIRIVGLDPLRPPRILKEPYINLFFKLSHKAPEAWCEHFNRLIGKRKYSVKVDPAEGLFVETWVRKPEEIEAIVEVLKETVRVCNEEYIANIQADAIAAAARAKSQGEDSSEQGQLNRIIERLNFDD